MTPNSRYDFRAGVGLGSLNIHSFVSVLLSFFKIAFFFPKLNLIRHARAPVSDSKC